MIISLKRVQIFCGFVALAILAATPGRAQEIKRPPLNIPASAESATKFVPEGWRMEFEKLREGDLNGDTRPDLAFVIAHGGQESKGAEEAPVKHVLVLLLKGDDGKFHRSMVSDSAVLDGDEGGAFGDPFDDLSIDRNAVVISHYGGSRERWGFTHRYRFQNGRWTLIGLDMGNTDTLDLEHYDNQDINLSTGLVEASEKGGYEGGPKKPETSGRYYELQVLPAEETPRVDGLVSNNEWPDHTVRLQNREQVLRNRKYWRDASDLSARIHSARKGDDLFIGVEVTDNQVTSGDAVRVVTKRGLIVRPLESRLSKSANGYVFEARFSLRATGKVLKRDDKYLLENLEMALEPAGPYGDFQGFAMPVSIEIVDADRGLPKARGVLSTRLVGSPYPGSIRIFRPGTLELISDVK